MKTFSRTGLIFLFAGSIIASSCDDDDEVTKQTSLTATQVTDLDAVSASKFTLFSFETNSIIASADSASNKWDIGFRGTTIILNGGVSGPGAAQGQLVDGIFEELITAPAAGYTSDSQAAKAITGSGGWYTYTGENVPQHAILPNAGKILAMKTASGKFVKAEILSYYQGNPSTTTATFADLATRPAARYFTFRFLYQPDGTTNLEATE